MVTISLAVILPGEGRTEYRSNSITGPDLNLWLEFVTKMFEASNTSREITVKGQKIQLALPAYSRSARLQMVTALKPVQYHVYTNITDGRAALANRRLNWLRTLASASGQVTSSITDPSVLVDLVAQAIRDQKLGADFSDFATTEMNLIMELQK
jgi:hypothetical protein